MVEIALQNRRLASGVFPDQRLGLGAVRGSEKVGHENARSCFRVAPNTAPEHHRVVEVVQKVARQDHIIFFSRNRRAGDITLNEPDPFCQRALRLQRLPGKTQHGRRAIHRMEGITGVRLRETKGNVGRTATQVQHRGSGRSFRKRLVEQRHVRLVRLGKIGRRVSARLLFGVHQLRFGNSFHGRSKGTLACRLLQGA